MQINPSDFEVTIEMIRQRLNLSHDVEIIPYGYEYSFDINQRKKLQNIYNCNSLSIRTRPDFLVITQSEMYRVEAKNKTNSIEAVQLFFNKQLEQMGIKVLYSFPNVTINASQIPMEKIIIPQTYRKEFDLNLKHLFNDCEFEYVSSTKGSGDPFVWIEESDLIELSGGNC